MYEYYKPSALELDIMELLREFRCLSKEQLDQLYKNEPGLDIALGNLYTYGMLKYDRDRNIYCATRMDEIEKHQLMVWDIFLAITPPDADKLEILLNSTAGVNYDVGYPLDDKFIYLVYADNTTRATKVARLADSIKANHGDFKRNKIIVVLRNEEDRILIPTSDIETELYTIRSGNLCRI